MSDSAQQPDQPEPRDPWAPPESRGGVPLEKRPPAGGSASGSAPAPAGSDSPAAVPPPPVAPTGPYDPVAHGPGPYGAQPPGPYPPAGYGGPYGHVPPGYGYGQHAPHGYGYGYGMPYHRPNNGLGVAALVLGIVGTVLFFTTVLAAILGVLAVIFGVVGRIRASRGEATNGGQALAGLILGIVAFLAGVGFLVAVVATAENEVESDDSGSYSLVLSDDERNDRR